MTNSRPTQTMRLLKELETGITIDGKYALEKLGIFRLPSRISELKKLGYIFELGWNTYTSKLYGDEYKMRTYKLIKEDIK